MILIYYRTLIVGRWNQDIHNLDFPIMANLTEFIVPLRTLKLTIQNNILHLCHIPVEPPCLHLVLDLLQQLVTFKVRFLTSSFYYLQESSLTETKGQLQRDVKPQWNNRTD